MEVSKSSITKNPVVNGVVESTSGTPSQYSPSQVSDDPMKKNIIGASADDRLPLGSRTLPSSNSYNHNWVPPPPYFLQQQQQCSYYIPTLPPASHFPPFPYIHDNNSYYYSTYTPPPSLLPPPSASFFVPPPLPPPPPGLYQCTALGHKIADQIDYYFCDQNLATDLYLKNRMDEEGWVPIDLIAGFRRVAQLSKDTKFVLESLIFSKNVEVEGRKVRRRGTWKKWLVNHPKPDSKI